MLNDKKKNRAIPSSSELNSKHLTKPEFFKQINSKDLDAVELISSELRSAGILREVEVMDGIRNEDNISKLLRDAEDRSVPGEGNKADYDSEFGSKLDSDKDISNPLMEKFDDYEGLDYNPAFRARDKFESARGGRVSKAAKRRRRQI